MFFIAALITLEIISGVLIAFPANTPNKGYLSQSEHDNMHRNILGESDAPTDTPVPENTQPPATQPTTQPPADTAQPPATQPTTQPPADTAQPPATQPTTQPPADTAQPTVVPEQLTSDPTVEVPTQNQNQDTPIPDSSTQNQQNTSQTSNTSTDSPVQIEVTPSPTEAQQTPSPSVSNDASSSAATSTTATISSLDAAVFPALATSQSESISSQTVQQSTSENQQLQETTTPIQEAKLLVQFSNNNIQSINANISGDKLSDVNYRVQRLGYEINKTLDTIQGLNPTEAKVYKNKVNTICKNTEFLLRPSELLVPEDVEQTIEITRGKCFNLQE